MVSWGKIVGTTIGAAITVHITEKYLLKSIKKMEKELKK